MKTLNLIQGSDEWKAIRGKYRVASEAPIVMGCSPHMSRDDLLKYKTIASEQEVTRFQQIIFDKGHAVEAKARPIAEEILDEDLIPLTGIKEFKGAWYLASFDGLTIFEDNHWEHKQYNEKLFNHVKSGKPLEPFYYWQLEHQLLVNGNDSCIFAVSDGTKENYVQTVYKWAPERREQLVAAWDQFDKDKENYVPIFVEPKAVAELSETLPAITYSTARSDKGLSLTSNLDEYKKACVALVERSKVKMETDQDFANAESRVKQCKEAEEKISHLQKQVLGEFADIDKFCRDLGAISEMLRQCRLNEEKQVQKRKDEIRLEIINNAKSAFELHIKSCNTAIAALDHGFKLIVMPHIDHNFAEAIKGKRTIKTLHEAANDKLADLKISANKVLSKIDENLAMLKVAAKDYGFLFADIQNLITKDKEDLQAIAINRIAEHKKAEQEKLAEAANAPAAAVSYTVREDLQPTLFDAPLRQASSIEDEYFGAPCDVVSPVADESGKPTIIGREQIIIAVMQHWGLQRAHAELSCIQAFESK